MARESGTPSASTTFALLLGLSAFVVFFLARPLLAGQGPYYGPRTSTGSDYWYVVVAAFIPYGLALRAYGRGARPATRSLFIGAAVLYVALIPAAAQQSQDVYQTLLYARMALAGHNPYVVYAATLHDPWRAWTLWDNTRSVYGPVWTMLTMGVVRIAGNNLTAAFLMLKAATAALALLATWTLTRAVSVTAGRPGDGTRTDAGFTILAFAYNPMVLFSVGLGAHADIGVAAALGAAVLAERKGHSVLTTVFLAVAALVKAYSGLALIAWLIYLMRRRGARTTAAHALAAAALAALCYGPFWDGLKTFGGVADVGRTASGSLTGSLVRVVSGHLSDGAAAGSSPAGAVIRIAASLLLILAVVHAARSRRAGEEPWRAAALMFGAYVLLTPWYLSWHLIGLVALAAVVTDDAVTGGTLVFSATSLFVGFGGTPVGLAVQTVVRYAPPLITARQKERRRRDSNPGTSVTPLTA